MPFKFTITAMGFCLILLGACSSVASDPTPDDISTKPALLLDAGEGAAIDFPLHPTKRLAFADQTVSGLSLFELTIPANSAGAPPHSHAHEDEFFYVREGSITFMADDRQKTISAGGFVMLPRGGWHAMWNGSDVDTIMLVGTSDGKFDDFFDAVAMEASKAGQLTPPEIGAIVGRIGAARGIKIDMRKVPNAIRPLYGMPPEL